ncbi:MAG: hypothetical protein PHQ23_15575, partial [Candidatus Wallbacteria bacterium]|nr:hypothetical protein [Candidatus Wallbacteria bacterium]
MKVPNFITNPLITRDEVISFCREAVKNGFGVIPVPLTFIDAVREKFPEQKFSALIGYPLGTSSPQAKRIEVREAIRKGVAGIELLLNISAIKDRDEKTLRTEIELAVKAAGAHPVKVIIEKSLLDAADGRFAFSIMERYDLTVKDGIGADPAGIRFGTGRLYNKIVRIMLSDMKAGTEEFPASFGLLAGRALAVRLAADENSAP